MDGEAAKGPVLQVKMSAVEGLWKERGMGPSVPKVRVLEEMVGREVRVPHRAWVFTFRGVRARCSKTALTYWGGGMGD